MNRISVISNTNKFQQKKTETRFRIFQHWDVLDKRQQDENEKRCERTRQFEVETGQSCKAVTVSLLHCHVYISSGAPAQESRLVSPAASSKKKKKPCRTGPRNLKFGTLEHDTDCHSQSHSFGNDAHSMSLHLSSLPLTFFLVCHYPWSLEALAAHIDHPQLLALAHCFLFNQTNNNNNNNHHSGPPVGVPHYLLQLWLIKVDQRVSTCYVRGLQPTLPTHTRPTIHIPFLHLHYPFCLDQCTKAPPISRFFASLIS